MHLVVDPAKNEISRVSVRNLNGDLVLSANQLEAERKSTGPTCSIYGEKPHFRPIFEEYKPCIVNDMK